MKVSGGEYPLVSVKSEQPLPKGLLMQCIKAVNNVCVRAPIQIGDVLVENILNTGVSIVSTKNISVCKDIGIAVRSEAGTTRKS
jgi:CxxC motif-containing protein